MNASPLPHAVVLGLSPTGLHCIRALARTGVKVWGVGDRGQVGAASKYCEGVFSDDEPDALLANLIEWGANLIDKPVLIPSSDQHVEFIAKNHVALGRHFVFQASYQDGLAQQLMAKDSFATLCEQHNVELPETLTIKADALLENAAALPFPCMIKPAEIHRVKDAMKGQKGWTAKSPQELHKIAEHFPDQLGDILVQEIVAGPESNITLVCAYFDADAEAHQTFTARKLRQFPPGFGSASLVQSNPEPESEAIFTRLLKATGYRGIAAGEFKRDPVSGELKIIEINVRPSLWFSLSEECARPVVMAAYRDLAGLEPAAQISQQNGVRWSYGLKDAFSRLFYFRTKGFILPAPDTEVVGPADRVVHPVFLPDDFKPVLAETVGFLHKASRRFFPR